MNRSIMKPKKKRKKPKKEKKHSDDFNGPNTLTAVHAVNTLALIKECMCCTAGPDRRSRHGFESHTDTGNLFRLPSLEH